MSLPHALLTSLLERPSSGYELARRFGRSIGYFWPATHQQIYRELARMEAAGWIEGHVPPDAGRTRKKAWQVLTAGRDELARWTAAAADQPDRRDPLTVRLRAEAVLDAVDLRPELARHLALHEAQLAVYRDIARRDFPSPATLDRAQAIRHAILRRGIVYEEGQVAWARETLEVLEESRTAMP